MARNNAPQNRSGGRTARQGRGKSKGTGTAASTASAKASVESNDPGVPEWDEVTEDLSVIPDLEGLIGGPAANTGNDSEARRRIEMLREERLLQQALSDVFDL